MASTKDPPESREALRPDNDSVGRFMVLPSPFDKMTQTKKTTRTTTTTLTTTTTTTTTLTTLTLRPPPPPNRYPLKGGNPYSRRPMNAHGSSRGTRLTRAPPRRRTPGVPLHADVATPRGLFGHGGQLRGGGWVRRGAGELPMHGLWGPDGLPQWALCTSLPRLLHIYLFIYESGPRSIQSSRSARRL